MTRVALVFWGLLLLVMCGLFGWRMMERQKQQAAVESEEAQAELQLVLEEPQNSKLPPHQVVPFQLTERSGETFDSQQMQGQVWVASFFFTACPGACLKLNHAIADLQKELPDLPVRFVSITVDPANDTPEALRKYADLMHADAQRWLFVTGELAEIRRIAADSFQLSVDRITHSDRMLVVDRQGKIRGSYRATDDNQVRLMKKKLAEVLAEPA